MDDLTVVSEKKYKHLRRAAIIMPIVAAILVAACAWMMYALYQGLTAQYVPTKGIWYCEELGVELNFDSQSGDIMTDAAGTQYIISSHRKQTVVSVYSIAETVTKVKNGETKHFHYAGELVYQFAYVSLKGHKYTVQDNAGNKYVFVRK